MKEKDPNEIGALWEKTGRKGVYLSGTIYGKPVIGFRIDSTNPKAPAWRMLRPTPKPSEGDGF